MLGWVIYQVIINYLVDQAEKRATNSRKKADQVYGSNVLLSVLFRKDI